MGQTVTATVTAQAAEDGNLNNGAAVTSSILDPIASNNSAVVTTAVAEPAIVVSAPKSLSGKNQSNVAVATFTHANGIEPASAFVATINWGDGSNSTGTISESGTTYTVKGSHTYSSNGSHTATTTVVESDSSPKPKPGAPGNPVTMSSGSGSPRSPIAALLDLALTDLGRVIAQPMNDRLPIQSLVDHVLADVQAAGGTEISADLLDESRSTAGGTGLVTGHVNVPQQFGVIVAGQWHRSKTTKIHRSSVCPSYRMKCGARKTRDLIAAADSKSG